MAEVSIGIKAIHPLALGKSFVLNPPIKIHPDSLLVPLHFSGACCTTTATMIGHALLPQGRGVHRRPPHGVPAISDPRFARKEGGKGVPSTVELGRAARERLADFGVPSRDAPLRKGPALRLPGDSTRWTRRGGMLQTLRYVENSIVTVAAFRNRAILFPPGLLQTTAPFTSVLELMVLVGICTYGVGLGVSHEFGNLGQRVVSLPIQSRGRRTAPHEPAAERCIVVRPLSDAIRPFTVRSTCFSRSFRFECCDRRIMVLLAFVVGVPPFSGRFHNLSRL